MTNPITEKRLREIEALRERATPGEWQIQDGCSWRRIGTPGRDGNVLFPDTYSRTDRHPDLSAGKGEDLYANLKAIVTLHNAFPDLAAALREAWAENERLRVAGQVLADTLVQHHQWHAAQTNPDPEHGFIPADEYADSSLYERTVTALAGWRQPVNEAALDPKGDGE